MSGAANIQVFTLVVATATIALALLFANGLRGLFARRWFTVGFAVALILVFVGLRYVPTLYYGFSGQAFVPKWQSLFLTDICPMFSVLMPVLMLFKSKFLAQAAAPIAMLGALIVLYGQFGAAGEHQADLAKAVFYDYVSRGEGGVEVHNYGYFTAHYSLLLSSLAALLGFGPRNWRHLLSGGLAILVYYAYVGIVMAAFDLKYNVSGLQYYDWTTAAQSGIEGEYAVLQNYFFTDWKKTAAVIVPICVAGYLVICYANAADWRRIEMARIAARRAA